MGFEISKIFGTNQNQHFVDPIRIRRVWTGYINKKDRREEFFVKMYEVLIKRNPDLGRVLLQSEEPISDEEAKFVLSSLAENISDFFEELIDDGRNKLTNEKDFGDSCYACGMRHAAYTGKDFKVEYWDVFSHAMIETLRESNAVSAKDIQAWQYFLRKIVRHMKEGYDQGMKQARPDDEVNCEG